VTGRSISEHVLQRELHDARVVRDPQYTEIGISDFGAHTIRAGVEHSRSDRGCWWWWREQRPEAVGDVIDFPSELDALAFLQSERTHESHVEIKVTGRGNGSGA